MENLIQLMLTEIVVFLLTCAFALIEFLADKNVIKTAPSNFDRKKFHLYGFLRRGLVVVSTTLFYYGPTVQALGVIALSSVIFWFVFEMLMSRELFNSPFAVGTTAFTDKQIRRLAEHLGETPEETKRALVLVVLFFSTFVFVVSCSI